MGLVQIRLQLPDLLEAGRGEEQASDAIALAPEEPELSLHAAQVGAALHALRVDLGDPRRDELQAVGRQLDVRLHGQIAMALGGASLLRDALALQTDGV